MLPRPRLLTAQGTPPSSPTAGCRKKNPDKQEEAIHHGPNHDATPESPRATDAPARSPDADDVLSTATTLLTIKTVDYSEEPGKVTSPTVSTNQPRRETLNWRSPMTYWPSHRSASVLLPNHPPTTLHARSTNSGGKETTQPGPVLGPVPQQHGKPVGQQSAGLNTEHHTSSTPRLGRKQRRNHDAVSTHTRSRRNPRHFVLHWPR